MEKLEKIKKEIKSLYSKGPIPWFFDFHVAVVASYAGEIAKREKANVELSVLAGFFHDIAYAWGATKEHALMNESLEKTEEMMKKAGYSSKEILAVKHAIIPHSCRGKSPASLEGKVLATADALAHLMTDFYFEAPVRFKEISNIETFKSWAREKIERDFHKKIFFEPERQKARKRYDALKTLLGE